MRLRVHIHQEHPWLAQCQSGGKVDGGGGFTHAALLITDRDPACHYQKFSRELPPVK
jgi:hypothetical protein